MTEIEGIKGNPDKREKFLQEHRPFIHAIASGFCGRPLDWGRDEELSIALLAFNSAIDAWSSEGGASFKTFARLVIKRRLTDYFRKVTRKSDQEIPLPENMIEESSDEEFLRLERVLEIQAFEEQLERFDISFNTLSRESPRQQEVRQRLLQTVDKISAQPELTTEILRKGRLPLEQLVLLTGETRKVLGKRRRYLLALLLVNSKKEEFPFISEYLGLKGGKPGE